MSPTNKQMVQTRVMPHSLQASRSESTKKAMLNRTSMQDRANQNMWSLMALVPTCGMSASGNVIRLGCGQYTCRRRCRRSAPVLVVDHLTNLIRNEVWIHPVPNGTETGDNNQAVQYGGYSNGAHGAFQSKMSCFVNGIAGDVDPGLKRSMIGASSSHSWNQYPSMPPCESQIRIRY